MTVHDRKHIGASALQTCDSTQINDVSSGQYVGEGVRREHRRDGCAGWRPAD